MATEREEFVCWITRYALTGGIIEKRVELCSNISDQMISVISGKNEIYHGKDWHRTKIQAVLRAKEMQLARLKQLDKQCKRIAALKFD